MIRQAQKEDISLVAEILIFSKRVHYREIFQNDYVSFHEMTVLGLCQEYLNNLALLSSIYVYEDEFVKGMIHLEDKEIKELYVNPFFEGQGIGSKLIEEAISRGCNKLWVLEKNKDAIVFYQKHGFSLTADKKKEYGEYIVKMIR